MTHETALTWFDHHATKAQRIAVRLRLLRTFRRIGAELRRADETTRLCIVSAVFALAVSIEINRKG